jgi:hypothetical protein
MPATACFGIEASGSPTEVWNAWENLMAKRMYMHTMVRLLVLAGYTMENIRADASPPPDGKDCLPSVFLSRVHDHQLHDEILEVGEGPGMDLDMEPERDPFLTNETVSNINFLPWPMLYRTRARCATDGFSTLS